MPLPRQPRAAGGTASQRGVGRLFLYALSVKSVQWSNVAQTLPSHTAPPHCGVARQALPCRLENVDHAAMPRARCARTRL
jgi:hypothetical protein